MNTLLVTDHQPSCYSAHPVSLPLPLGSREYPLLHLYIHQVWWMTVMVPIPLGALNPTLECQHLWGSWYPLPQCWPLCPREQYLVAWSQYRWPKTCVLISPDDVTIQSMSMKETTQVSAIHALFVTQVPFPNDTELLKIFMEKLLNSLLHKNMHPLRFVCQMLGCIPAKNTRFYKADYAKTLI